MEPQTREEMESIIHEAVGPKNRYFHRGGFSPYQLVIGENPRLPKELLSDEAIDEVGLEHLSGTAADTDTAAAAFSRKHQVRQPARQNLMRMEAKSRVAEAVASRASTPNNFSPGQWVYVWRKVKGRAKTHVLQRDRWVGPGAVVWQNGQTVLVAMRSRLWKWSSLQVRYATRAESLGAELLDEVTFKELQQDLKDPGKRVGATDVESEGEPPPEAWDSPQSAEGQAAPEPRVLTRRGIPAPPRSAPDSILEQASSGDPATGASSSSRPYTESEMDLEVSRSQKAARAQLLDDVPISIRRNLEEARQTPLPPQGSSDQNMGDDLWTLLCQQDEEEQDNELVKEVQSSDHMTDLSVRTLRALQDPIFSGIASQSSKQGQRQSVEVNVKNLLPDVQRRFGEADAKEWKAILESGAVRILSAKEASLVRRRYADRIISSRMVRRLKPQEGLGVEPLPKSRWCLRGHQEPDSEDLRVYAPTPQSESIMAVLRTIASLKSCTRLLAWSRSTVAEGLR